MNNIKNKFKKITVMTLCFIIISCFVQFSTLAAQQELKTVQVGYFAFDGYHMMSDNKLSGYGYEFLQKMLGYTNWKLEYVGYDKTWSEMQDMLENGQIQMLTSAQKTPQRLARFDFSEYSIGSSSVILTIKAGDSRYVLSDYESYNGMRVGMIANNSRNDNFKAYASKHNFTYTCVYYDSMEKMLSDLQESQNIDAVLTSNLRSIHNEWILDEFDPSPFYIMVKKGNTALLNEINEALEKLYSEEPNIATVLMNKYYSLDSLGKVVFNVAETNFIKSMKDTKFTAALNPDNAPFSWYTDEGYTGIAYDIAQKMILTSGLNIELNTYSTYTEYCEAVANAQVDIVFDIALDYNTAEEAEYRLTKSYLSVQPAKVYKRSTREFNSVALIKDSDIARNFEDQLITTGKHISYYTSTDELINAVLSGKADVAYLYDKTALDAVYKDETNSLVAENIYKNYCNFTVGINSNKNNMLYSVINKTIASVTQDEIDSILASYSAKDQNSFSLIGFMYDNPLVVTCMAFGTCFIILIIISLCFKLKKRKKEHIELIKQQEKNELLKNALETAEKAGLAKSQFLSRVSHEMRTPLNAIIGFMTLAKDADEEKRKEYMANSQSAAKQLLGVINDVLDMSSIESGKMSLSEVAFDFKHLVQSLTDIYVLQCDEKNIKFETKLSAPLDEWIIGDELRLNQILINLLGNSVKFTQKGSITLKINQYNSSAEKVFIRFEVTDTGNGMSEDMQKRLFKPFEQESGLTAQKYGGTGLGLSIVKNIVTMMGGAISVESELNVGSKFTVDLPFTKCANKTFGYIDKEIKDLNVLCIDDEETERNYISIVLERIGVKHTLVRSGEEAIKALAKGNEKKEPFNICLIDWNMPNVNGIETTRRIRKLYGDDVVLIIVSSYTHLNANENARKAGANMFISKPLFQSSLFDLFMNLTGGKVQSKKETNEDYVFSDKRVLLCEDNMMNRAVAEGLINRFGIKCESACDGLVGSDMFINSMPGYYDAVLMDIQMPNMDGFEATKAIRASQHPNAKSIPIIALTANAFNEDISKVLSEGMNSHVSKPIDPDLLLIALKKAFLSNK